jgi:3'-5' exoribonuclease
VLRLCELKPGQSGDFFALLAERTPGITREGKPYFTCRFQDLGRTATFMVWADSPWFEACQQQWQTGKFYKVRADYGEHDRYGPQLDIHNIREVTEADWADGFNPADFQEGPPQDPEALFAELCQLAQKEIGDPPLRRLVLTLLERQAEPFKRVPATIRNFYPFPGGLLMHTLAVAHSCLLLADRYIAVYADLAPPLNRDLIVAGAILHDIGRTLELDGSTALAEPTVSGRLLGHLFLGRDLVRDTAREIPDLNPELVLLLEHLIVSHLNLPEWGSPRLPLIPESLILHHADDLDAKLEMYVRCLRHDTAAGLFTDRDPVLHRQLFKGRSV